MDLNIDVVLFPFDSVQIPRAAAYYVHMDSFCLSARSNLKGRGEGLIDSDADSDRREREQSERRATRVISYASCALREMYQNASLLFRIQF